MWLPDDEARAVEVAELLIEHGADPSIKSKDGKTAAEYAEELGLYAAADRLRVSHP
jgi:ankyrin repeat protein